MDKLTRQKLVEELYSFSRTAAPHTMSQKQVDAVKQEADRLVEILSIMVREEAAAIASRMNDVIDEAFNDVSLDYDSLASKVSKLDRKVAALESRTKADERPPNMVV